MDRGRILVTGGTGMVGAMFAQRARAAGYAVRALVRSVPKADALAKLGIELAEGDLARPESLPPAVAGIDVIVHAAAHVGDWGPVEQYRAINVYALEHLLTAAEHEGRLKRFVDISTLGVYPARHHYGSDESLAPDIEGLDGYTRTKAEAEVVLGRHAAEYHLPVVILRPGFIYGPGDRHLLPQLAARLKAGKMKLIGDGQKLLNNTYVGNLCDAIFLAIEKDEAVGEVFNIRDQRLVTREEFVGTIADYLGCPRPAKVPLWVARLAVGFIEGFARLRRATEAPILTRARIKFLALNLDFSIAKARKLLGYAPQVDFRDGMRLALEAMGNRGPGE
ncbi:MAG: NAD-dependent epimerase/dehydratase family protein [Thermoguttaceae bacterium]|jgi:nucleoside-diphosphate-sugar epimerase